MRHAARLLLAVAAGGVAAGCGADVPLARRTVRDSAGVRIVESSPPFPEWRLAATPVLRIGVLEGDGAYQLHNVAFAGRLADHGVVLIDGGTGTVRWYDARGAHRTSAGRRGQGPGEFRSIFPDAVFTRADSLLVHDGNNRRLTWLAPEGTIAREASIPQVHGDVRVLGVDAAGRVLLSASRTTFNFDGRSYTYSRDTVTVLALGDAGPDTIVRFPGSETAIWVRYRDGQPVTTMTMQLPFGYATHLGLTSAGIVIAATERNRLEVLDESGGLHGLWRRADAGPPLVTEAHRKRYIEYAVERVRNPRNVDLAEVRTAARDRVALLPDARPLPAFDALLVGRDGRIWVRDFVPDWDENGPRTWTIYDRSGSVIALVTTPAGLHVTEVGDDYVVGVERDDTDVEYVVVRAIDRTGS